MPLKDYQKHLEYNRKWWAKKGKNQGYYQKYYERFKKWRASEKGKISMALGSQKFNCLRRHGITLEQRHEMYIKQKGLCGICNQFMDENSCFIDHDHKTDKNRELLCRHCNSGLGFFKDNQIYLQKAIDYLDRHSCYNE